MTDKKLLICTATLLAILIPAPGRLAYGIIFIITFNFAFLFYILLNFLLKKLDIHSYSHVIMPLALVSFVTCERFVLMMLVPVIALQLALLPYIQAFSVYMLYVLHRPEGLSIKADLKSNLRVAGYFSAVTFCFSLIRDILGFGTLSLPSSLGVLSFQLIPAASVLPFMNFFASIPGAAILSSVILSFIPYLRKNKEKTIFADDKSLEEK
ncbi:hypothetical protein HRI96_06070 [Treponema parvum]|uniref:Electron transport complex protein RnfE n=1 Tax=Treponema parvum TaxID=138851 RepID=A0A975ICD5_9SPIR|nr:hypothetical protein [Treponema parvum]QTQ11805.1 hypothetical protein HRI96_06070 [Treponema parvum]